MLKIYSIIFLLFCILIYSCSNDGQESHSAKNIDSLQIDNKPAIDSIDTIVRLVYRNDSVFMQIGDSVIIGEYLKPTVYNDKYNSSYTTDNAQLIANCMIISRGYDVKGDFCHFPGIDSIEIYTKDGEKKVLTGSFNNNAFNGNYSSSPDHSWVIINDEAEGDIYGFTVFTDKGEMNYVPLDKYGGYEVDAFKAVFINDTTLFCSESLENYYNLENTLTIYKNGKYKVDWLAKATDTTRLLIFFGHEQPPIQQGQNYWKVIKEKDGIYKREIVEVKDIASLSSKWGCRLNNFDRNVKFIYSGLNACSDVIKAYNEGVQIEQNTPILVQEFDGYKSYVRYENEQVYITRYKEGTLIDKQSLIDFKEYEEYYPQNNRSVYLDFVGDIDCDNLYEAIVRFEIGNTFYYTVLKPDSSLNYKIAVTESLYWD